VLVPHRLNTVWLERIHLSGVPLVEIFCAREHFDYQNRSQVNELGYWFADCELKCHSLHAPIFTDDCWGRTGPGAVISITERDKPRRLAAVDEIKRAIEVAEKIPFQYLIQHLGVAGEEYDDYKVEAAFSALEDLCLFARHRGVEILLENIPNHLASGERLNLFNELTHLNLNYCFDTGHANAMEGVQTAFALMRGRIRSTHVHDNNGRDDRHLFPTLDAEGTVEWPAAMKLLNSIGQQAPLLLEIKDSAAHPRPLESVGEIFTHLESL
jgi:sugar phosphate isomerase/epimerase